MAAQPKYKPHERSPLSPCPMDRNVVYVKDDCGCTIEGCGHIPDPVRPKLCVKHSAAPAMYDALLRARMQILSGRETRASKVSVDIINAALSKAEGRDGT